jgi:hypothetical protein
VLECLDPLPVAAARANDNLGAGDHGYAACPARRSKP